MRQRTGHWLAGLLLGGCLSGPAARAAQLPVTEGDVAIADFAFRSGEHLPLRLHYVAVGTPHRDAVGRIDNAVLLLHGTTGNARNFLQPSLADNLFGPGQPLDAARVYSVLADGIGAGGSTKPSDGLRSRFPHYGYVDQVEAQHAMLDGLGITHLKLVSGISQGGMQTWLWGERYPDAMDALAPVASMPMQISGRNLLWRLISIHAIEDDPDYHGGEYDPAHPPTQWTKLAAPLFAIMVGNADRLQTAGSDREKTLAQYDSLIARYQGRDANDTLYDYRSSADYDPAPEVGRIRAPLLAINFADDLVNPDTLPQPRETVEHLPGGRFVLLDSGGKGYGHAAIFQAENWTNTLGDFLDALPSWRQATR